MIRFDFSGTDSFIDKSQWDGFVRRACAAHNALKNGTGAGSEWLGWRRILSQPNDALLEDISVLAREIREKADVLLCVGIGGSYLGAEALIRALSPYFPRPAKDEATSVIFAGHHLCGAYLEQLLASLEGKSVYVNVISKSGTTLEPAVAFRIIRAWMERHFDDCDKRIIATTDANRGALKNLAEKKGYRTYTIADDIGGRFSVLSPVGLIPVAAAGFDIRSLFYGAVAMMGELDSSEMNPATEYALRRYMLHETGYTTEILSVFEPGLSAFGSWWQQLFAESEGKERKGLFPSVCTFSTDLHSLGQYIQSGRRNLMETFLTTESERSTIEVPFDHEDLDGLNYLSGIQLKAINKAAFKGTVQAHANGGIPVNKITISSISEEDIGRLIYFFEHSVSVGGYLLGVNPFDQPGVEAYKQEMFSLLGRPVAHSD